MTWTLYPFDEKHPLDGRAYKDRIGRPHYGPSALRRLLAADTPKSLADRDRMARIFWGLVAVIVCGAVSIAIVWNV
jgi:hypothetical protein